MVLKLFPSLPPYTMEKKTQNNNKTYLSMQNLELSFSFEYPLCAFGFFFSRSQHFLLLLKFSDWTVLPFLPWRMIKRMKKNWTKKKQNKFYCFSRFAYCNHLNSNEQLSNDGVAGDNDNDNDDDYDDDNGEVTWNREQNMRKKKKRIAFTKGSRMNTYSGVVMLDFRRKSEKALNLEKSRKWHRWNTQNGRTRC